MHSHSGQFCPGHAQDQLEAIIQTAISKGFRVLALTEHMPLISASDLYPEQLPPTSLVNTSETLASLSMRHASYLFEAERLRSVYAPQIKLVIGFEGEWIRPDYAPLITSLSSHPSVDFFIGSVHHVNEIPIDYNLATYGTARNEPSCGGTDRGLFRVYYDAQFQMLQMLKPKLVGHFDLIKLFSDEPGMDLRVWPDVWERVERNLRFIVQYGGLVELNTAALRKGLKEPYPGKVVSEEFLRLGGRLSLSDDSHGIAQVATHYEQGP